MARPAGSAASLESRWARRRSPEGAVDAHTRSFRTRVMHGLTTSTRSASLSRQTAACLHAFPHTCLPARGPRRRLPLTPQSHSLCHPGKKNSPCCCPPSRSHILLRSKSHLAAMAGEEVDSQKYTLLLTKDRFDSPADHCVVGTCCRALPTSEDQACTDAPTRSSHLTVHVEVCSHVLPHIEVFTPPTKKQDAEQETRRSPEDGNENTTEPDSGASPWSRAAAEAAAAAKAAATRVATHVSRWQSGSTRAHGLPEPPVSHARPLGRRNVFAAGT